jgi:hypothetical protein
LKRTDCHLIQQQKQLVPTQISSTTTSTANNQTAVITGTSSASNILASHFKSSNPNINNNINSGSKAKPYDVDDVQKYMQSKKTKRIYETKSEKEKQKKEDEERKKKLAELYRKQRAQTAAGTNSMAHGAIDSSSNIVPQTSTLTSSTAQRSKSMKILSNKNDSSSSNEYHDSTVHGSNQNLKFIANSSIGITKPSSSHKLYEQDMSKILLDKITHLLNDNDKLVEKQRKQLQITKSNNHKLLNQIPVSTMKRVDFAVNYINLILILNFHIKILIFNF